MTMSASLLADLGASGLGPGDINAREAAAQEFAAINVHSGGLIQGYVIPYHDIHGDPISFYRVKLIDHDPKYKQPSRTPNHIYFPPNFKQVLAHNVKTEKRPYVIITEGEKKSACACKNGFPAVAIGGVYSWKNRTILLPKDTEILKPAQRGSSPRLKFPSTDTQTIEEATLAIGLPGLIDTIAAYDMSFFICFDSDLPDKGHSIKIEVQKAAAQLGYELRHRGLAINRIRQLILPNGTGKVGIDDFISEHGADAFSELIKNNFKKRNTFPRHPNPKEYINHKLQGKLTRKESQSLSLAILSELDARGVRLRSKATSTPYFFDDKSFRLIPVALMQKHGEPLHESVFGEFLYKEFGLSATDGRVLSWLASQFTGEPPIEYTEPQRVLAIPDKRPDCIALQLSDSQFALVTPDPNKPLEIHNNGSEGLLFVQDQVEPTSSAELLKEFHKQLPEQLKPWWLEVYDDINMDQQRSKTMAALLTYISPWLYRWRGTQLPIELFIGEAGSGKSSLCSLRLSIITGKPLLRNVPGDLRDWYASVTSAGGLHVIDNVQFTNKDLKQRLSDELCRITTEPKPFVEMRKLYSTTGQIRVPIRITFAMTAIQQPFHNQDIIQRSAIFELAAIEGAHDGSWVDHQIEKYSGRTKWLAHHLVFLHKFLNAAVNGGAWDTEYTASHRLANYEQCLLIGAETLGIPSDWIAESISTHMDRNLSDADWALEGLKMFAKEHRIASPDKRFAAADIAAWASMHEDFEENQQLINARRLGRYIQSHTKTVERIAGIKQAGSLGNRKAFKLTIQP